MRNLCHEWHRGIHSAAIKEYRSWPPALASWSVVQKGVGVRADELTSNRSLADEGRIQRHCVYSYSASCLQGRSAIVSLRWFDAMNPAHLVDRITIEVELPRREIVQIRGKMNRPARDEEMRAIRQWAGDTGLRIYDWAN